MSGMSGAAASLVLILELGLASGFVGGGELSAFTSPGLRMLRCKQDAQHRSLGNAVWGVSLGGLGVPASPRTSCGTGKHTLAQVAGLRMAEDGSNAGGKNLPSGSVWEQREALNKKQMVREAAYEGIKRKIRASSYEFGEADYRRLFAQFDKDRNGVLSLEEFQQLCQRMGLRPWIMTDEEIKIMLAEVAETNSNAEFGIMEFLQWVGQKTGVTADRYDSLLSSSGSSSNSGDLVGLPKDPTPQAWTYGESLISQVENVVSSDPGNGWTYGASGMETSNEKPSVEPEETPARNLLAASGARSGRARKAQSSKGSLEEMVQSWVSSEVSAQQVGDVIYFLKMELQISDNKILGMAISNAGIFEQDVEETLRYSVERLVELGVPVSKLKKVITSWPVVLEYGIDRWQENIDFLGDYGLVGEKFGKCIALCPNILELSVDDNLMPTIDFLVVEGGVPLTKVGQVILAFPNILSYSVELNLRPKLKFIQGELGVPKDKVASLLLKFPQIVGLSVESNIVPTVNFLVDQIGVDKDDVSKIVQQHPQVLGLSVQENLKNKYEFLLNEVGVPANKLASVVAAFPTLLSLSITKNLRPKIQFLLDEAGYHIEDIIKSPNLLAYSLDQRMRPRYLFLRSRGIRIALGSMLSYSDKQFQEKFGDDDFRSLTGA